MTRREKIALEKEGESTPEEGRRLHHEQRVNEAVREGSESHRK